MSCSDTSSSARTRFLRNRTMALFHTSNPQARESGSNTTFPGSAQAERAAGQFGYTVQTAYKPVADVPACCPVATTPCVPGTITNFQGGVPGGDPLGSLIFPNGGDGTLGDPYYYNVSWNPLAGAVSYTVTSTLQDSTIPIPPDLIESTGPTSAKITAYQHDLFSEPTRTFRVSAQTNCGTTSTSLEVTPCFLAGSLVHMADGTVKAIEDVRVGDDVLGAFGEINTVLALHRPLLGGALMCKINDEHSTTNHHPHISVDRKFYCGNPDLLSSTTYGCVHKVIDADGQIVDRMLHGLKKERICQLAVGHELKTAEGSCVVKTLETYTMAPDTQLYNLVVGGSHTYHVDGYAVTGWPAESDFNYDTWRV